MRVPGMFKGVARSPFLGFLGKLGGRAGGLLKRFSSWFMEHARKEGFR